MSHFNVMVVGNNVADQLRPYHEFECTGCDDEFVQNVDRTEELLDRMSRNGESLQEVLEEFGLEDDVVSSEDEVNELGEHKYGWTLVKNGLLVKSIRRTNPNAKWDWWTMGGRWSDKLILKDGSKTYQARKSEIDFERMQDIAEAQAVMLYDRVRKSLVDANLPTSWLSWKECVAALPNDHEGAFKMYYAQPSIDKIEEEIHVEDIDEMLMPRDEYIRQARDSSICCFAIIKDGTWHQRGRMGWFCAVSEEDEHFATKFRELLNDIPNNVMLTVVDCHI